MKIEAGSRVKLKTNDSFNGRMGTAQRIDPHCPTQWLVSVDGCVTLWPFGDHELEVVDGDGK